MFKLWTDWLFNPLGLTPHGFCLLWQPGLVWIHAVADATTGLAYFSIPLALAVFARRRHDLAFRPVFLLFAAFILLCGTGHWFDLLTLWVPSYGVQGVVKATTAVVSIVTAVGLWLLLPHALALPSPAQLREANRALRESEARHRASFEQSPVPTFTLDPHGLITGVSQSWVTLLGHPADQVVGRPLNVMGHTSEEVWTPANWRALALQGEVRDLPRQFVRPDGMAVDVLLSARLERRGDAAGAVCVLVDVTARRRAEEALRVSENRLRHAQKMEAVGQLTGGLAHDLNNMLQGVSGYLELMERRIDLGQPTEAGRYVDGARQSLDRAAGLTQRMLAFGRRQALQPRAIDPRALVRGLEELIRRTVGPSVRLELQLGQGYWPAWCDPDQLESVLLNLAINARDAMPEGGTLVIGTNDRRLTRADLPGQDEAEPGDYVEIKVSDTGSGMTPEVLEHAFEPFFTTKPLGRGTGLGLSQVYGFIRQSNGMVRLLSELNQGTSVQFYLPRSLEKLESANRPFGEEAANAISLVSAEAAGRTVLLVEDEPSVHTVIHEALTDLGCRVLDADSGLSGLAILESDAIIDLLITDVGLPGLTGRQLAEAARTCRPDLPILLITGYAGTMLESMALDTGVEVLDKPFDLNALAGRVCTMLDMSPRAPPSACSPKDQPAAGHDHSARPSDVGF